MVDEGTAIIMKAGLPSKQQIDALNMWKAIVFLRSNIEKRSMRIHEVRPEDIINWI